MATLSPPQCGQIIEIDDEEAQRLTDDSIKPSYGVQIKALSSNIGKVYVGYDINVSSTNSYELSAGQEMFVSLAEVQDSRDIWIVANTGNQGVCWRVV